MANGNDKNNNINSSQLIEAPKLPNVKKVGVIYSDVKREYFPTEEQYITEKDALHDAEVIAEEIKKLGIDVELYPGNETIIENINKGKPDMVFNLVDSVKGNEYLASTIPGMLDIMDVPYTGSGLLGLALCFNKFLSMKLLRNAGLPVPNFQLFNTHTDQLDNELRFPLISKLNEIHGAVEITANSISENEKHLRDRVKFLIDTYNQPVLVEEYIAGREITVLILEGTNTKTYMAEKVFNKPNEKYVMATFEDQWLSNDKQEFEWPYNYAKFDDPVLKELSRKAFELTRMADYAKFDLRQDLSGRYYFIDSNANPSFGPKELYTAIGLVVEKLYGVSFAEIVSRIIRNTIMNENNKPAVPVPDENNRTVDQTHTS